MWDFSVVRKVSSFWLSPQGWDLGECASRIRDLPRAGQADEEVGVLLVTFGLLRSPVPWCKEGGG